MKNIYRFFPFIFLVVFSLCFELAAANKIVGKAAIVIDYDTNKTLIEVNADTLNYPASLTKIMTLYIVFDYIKNEKISWETKMKVSKIAASRSPSKLYLEPGSTIAVKDAVMALIIKSANDVATVISEHISGSEKHFAKLMTNYAKNLGMHNTTFKNASGLPNRSQLTTVRDISILSHSLIKNFPNEYKLFSKEKFIWNGKTYKTHNKLMKTYKGADGIKTGYIYDAGFQLAFSAKRKDRRLIGVVFGGDSSKQRNKTVQLLMNKGFEKTKINIAKKNEKKEFFGDYQIVVGTFKYKKNAEKHLKLIKKKYPKTTSNKTALVSFIKSNGKQLYESRFRYFTKKNAQIACSRLKKYKRDCFIRG